MSDIVKKNLKVLIIILLLIIIINIFNVLTPYILKIIIDDFVNKEITNNINTTLTFLLSMYVLIWIFTVVLQLIKSVITNKISNKMLKQLREKVFSKVLNMKLKTFSKFQSSDIYTRLTVDVDNVKSLFTETLPIIINDLLSIVLIIIVMATIDFKLAIIGYIVIIAMACFSYVIVYKVKKASEKILEKRDIENRHFSESFNKSKITKMFSLEKNNIQKLNKVMDEELKYRKRYINIDSFLFPGVTLIEAIGVYAIIYYVLNIELTISLGTVYIFLYYIKQSFAPLKEIFNQLEEIQTSQLSLKRIDTILKIKEKNEDIDKGLNIEKLNGNIEFKNVYFKYKKKDILKDVFFNITSGQKVALVGKTGVGKSTITNILMRLYDIKSGEITIDGHNLYDLSIKSIRNNISYISQNAYVFKDTVRNNIILDNTKITDDELLKVFKDINAMQLLEKLENGLDTIIDINRLSKGETQILAFIRAIVIKAHIYIFDEPTSNIDLRTEQMIQNIIDKISKKSTVIIIAHRLSTIQNVDKIIHLKDGTVEKIEINDLNFKRI